VSITALAVAAVEVFGLVGGSAATRDVAIAVLVGLFALAVLAAFVAKPTIVLMGGWILFVAQQPMIGYIGDHSARGATVVGRLDDAILVTLAAAMVVRRIAGVAPTGRPTGWLLLLIGILAAVGAISAVLRADVGMWTLVGGWLSLKALVVLAAACDMPWGERD